MNQSDQFSVVEPCPGPYFTKGNRHPVLKTLMVLDWGSSYPCYTGSLKFYSLGGGPYFTKGNADSFLSPSPLQYLVVFGGFSELDGEDKCFSDLHFVDITAPSGNNTMLNMHTQFYCSSSGPLSWRSATPPGSRKPNDRYAHSAVVYKSSLYVLLGQNSDHDFNDAWRVTMKGIVIHIKMLARDVL
jgi:hypothetical protein